MKKWSVGLTIFGVLFIIIGVLDGLELWVWKDYGSQFDSIILRVGIGLHILGVVAGFGLLRRAGWARWLSILLAGVWATCAVWKILGFTSARNFRFSFLLTDVFETWWLTTLVWSGIILWYFLRTSVKAQFQK